MNLFTKYSEEETKLLLKVIHMKFDRELGEEMKLFKHFNTADIKKITRHFVIQEYKKKEVIDAKKMVYILEGSLAKVKNREIISRHTKDEVLGIESFLKEKSENVTIISLTDAKVALFTIDESEKMCELAQFYKNLALYLIDKN